METVWIIVIANIIICIANIANNWALAFFNKKKTTKEEPETKPTINWDKINKYGLIYFGIIYIFAIALLSLRIYGTMNFPDQDMLKNVFNISFNMAAIVMLALNYGLYFVSAQAVWVLSRIHERTTFTQECVCQLCKQAINKENPLTTPLT